MSVVLVVNSLTNEQLTVDVHRDMLVRQLKQSIKARIDVPARLQCLLFCPGKVMDDNQELNTYGVMGDGEQLLLQFTSEVVQIFVNICTGETITFGAQASDSIGHIKSKVFQLAGVPSESQNLSFAGTQLNDCHALLSKYSIQNGSILYLEVLETRLSAAVAVQQQ